MVKVIMLLICLIPGKSIAPGFEEYVDLGDGYEILQISGSYFALCYQKSAVLDGDFDRYALVPGYIVISTTGGSYLVNKASKIVEGPIPEAAIQTHPLIGGQQVHWIEIDPPLNVWLLGGSVLFVVFVFAGAVRYSYAWRTFCAAGKLRVPDEITDSSP